MISDEALIGEVPADNAVLTVDCGAAGSFLSLHTSENQDKQGFVAHAALKPLLRTSWDKMRETILAEG